MSEDNNVNDSGLRRLAVYQGQRWDMGPDVTPDIFLNSALIPHYPDLQGAQWRRTATAEEAVYEFSKRAGEKG